MGKLAAKTDQEWQDEAFTRQSVMDKLAYWREQLKQARAGFVQTPSVAQCETSLNTWLEELAGVAEIRWITGDESEWKRRL